MTKKKLFISFVLSIIFPFAIIAQNDTIFSANDSTIVNFEKLQIKQRRSATQLINNTDKSTAVLTDSGTVTKLKEHSPTKAVLLSILPGCGQIYNNKWWKLPIIYSGLALSGYFIYYYTSKMISCRNEYFFRQYDATEYFNIKWQQYSNEQILQFKNNYQRSMEIAIGVGAIIYMLNLVDALVDAHLFYFNISDDLSLQIMPVINTNPHFLAFNGGITFKLNLK